jgi:4'-phosphopantetheinyl transferase
MTVDPPTWTDPPPALDLSPAEVHVWRIALDPGAEVVHALAALLNADEQARAARCVAQRHRARFQVGRGMLRTILGRYLATAPERIAFDYGPHGKPSLGGDARASDVRFNLAHSQDAALLGVARGRDLGIDVEAIRPLEDAERIVTRFFSAREQADFLRLAPAERQAAFFRGWARKEAYIKAIGTGLALPLADFDVTLGPGEPPRLLRVAGRPDEPARWRFAEVAPGPAFQGAIAVEGDGWRLRAFTPPAVHAEAAGR